MSRASERVARAKTGTGRSRRALRARRNGAARFLRWVPGLVPLAQVRSLHSPGTRGMRQLVSRKAARVALSSGEENEVGRKEMWTTRDMRRLGAAVVLAVVAAAMPTATQAQHADYQRKPGRSGRCGSSQARAGRRGRHHGAAARRPAGGEMGPVGGDREPPRRRRRGGGHRLHRAQDDHTLLVSPTSSFTHHPWTR